LKKEDFYEASGDEAKTDSKSIPKKSGSGRLTKLFIIFFCLAFVLIMGLFLLKQIFSPPSDNTQSHGFISNFINLVPEEGSSFSDENKNINILILGIDKNWTQDNIMYTKETRTDTIMVAGLDLEKKTVGLLSIPRDSYVSIPSEYEGETYEIQGYEGKINGAYTDGGVELTKKVVEEVLQINIDYYILVKVNALPDLIDAIGGVEIYVEKDMDYDDNWGHLHIHLKEGWQLLDGNRAEGYSRFRNDEEGDLGRIRRQQQVLYAIKNRVGETKSILEIQRLIEATYKNVETDLSPRQILDLANIYKNVQKEDVKMATVPTGTDEFSEVSYQIIDYSLLPDYVNEYLLSLPPPVTVEIIDGNWEEAYSSQLAENLSSLGFRVLDIRNDGYIYDITHVIVHTDNVDMDKISAMIKLLGKPAIFNDETGEGTVDLTIVMGKDYSPSYSHVE